MALSTENITSLSPHKHAVRSIYTTSFTKEERMPFWLMLLQAQLDEVELVALLDDTRVCGFCYLVTLDQITFLMYLAIDENLRSQGYGSVLLSQIEAMYPDNKIILSIPYCDATYEQTTPQVRRKNFYLRNGYTDTQYLLKLHSKQQTLLIKNGAFDDVELVHFFMTYTNDALTPTVTHLSTLTQLSMPPL